jgi:hypothetical protein
VLVRQFAADKKTPGRSLYLLSRDKEYSLVGHVFSQLFPDDYDRVSPGGCWGAAVEDVLAGSAYLFGHNEQLFNTRIYEHLAAAAKQQQIEQRHTLTLRTPHMCGVSCKHLCVCI